MSPARRRPLVVANWKMHLGEAGARRLLRDLLPRLATHPAVETAVAPAFPVLRAVADALAGSSTALAAQDVHWEEQGAFTGEVAPGMLAELTVRFGIVGHSERRTSFGETDEAVGRKAAALRRHRIVPIVCVGETGGERDEGRTLEVVERQVRRALGDAVNVGGEEIVVAYEPVWAIGTGRTPTTAQVHDVHRMIREQLRSMFGVPAADRMRLLYGGSVSPANAAELLALDEVDGGLIGGASLDAAKFDAIVAAADGPPAAVAGPE